MLYVSTNYTVILTPHADTKPNYNYKFYFGSEWGLILIVIQCILVKINRLFQFKKNTLVLNCKDKIQIKFPHKDTSLLAKTFGTIMVPNG